MTQHTFSVITPTHIKGNRLDELYECLIGQTYTDWEWVVYVNGGGRVDQVPVRIRRDPRVRVYVDQGTPGANVGAVKRRAFSLGQGDVLVEVDHDDWITSDCLSELNQAYQDPDAHFVYSDAAQYHQDPNKIVPFRADHGWQWRHYDWQGQPLVAMRTFEATSHSVSQIWYAPDHVRSWRRWVYEELGGHNSSYPVADDHELLIRTYLNYQMVHIPKVLYVYHYHNDNTHQHHPTKQYSDQLFEQYGWDLAVRDAELRGLAVVDIGGGLNPRAGCITIDQEGSDIIADLSNGIPLADNSVGVINASHILEHLPDPQASMREIHRVLADGGWAFIEVPSTDGRGAWQDPTHISYWNEHSFWYYTRDSHAAFLRSNVLFREFKLDTVWPSEHLAITRAWLVASKGHKQYRPMEVV